MLETNMRAGQKGMKNCRCAIKSSDQPFAVDKQSKRNQEILQVS